MPPSLTPLVRYAGICPLPSRHWSDVSTFWRRASLATVHTHPTAAYAGAGAGWIHTRHWVGWIHTRHWVGWIRTRHWV
eukprot:3366318-Pyramimonas_sp.AAC.1